MSRRILGNSVLLVLLTVLGCGPATPAASPAGGEAAPRGTAGAPEARKTITVGALSSIKGFAPWLIGTTGGGSRSLAEAHTNGLATTDAAGNMVPQVAVRIPSLQDGSIVVLPDGRMQTTWTLRPNVRWHDGTPFTADDVVFSWQVNVHPEILNPAGQTRQRLERVEAPDPQTVVVTWTTTYSLALRMGFIDFWFYPKHLLGEAFQGDKEAFLNLPYWTTEYVQLGAFRVTDFGLGENLVLERFNDYFQGRPKVERGVIRIIPDVNTLLTNLHAAALDAVTENALPADLGAQLRDEWRLSGAGTVVDKQGNWRFVNIQHNPEFGRPAELRQDVRVRRGLLLALDRPGIREVMTPGFANTEADTFMPANDLRAPLVGKPFAGVAYDPVRAAQELAAAGWRRGPSGPMVNAAGEPVQLHVRITANAARELPIIAQSWRDLGMDVAEEIIPGSLAADRPYRATFPSMEVTAQGNGEGILNRFDGRQCPRPPRFSGSQGGCYTNPELDRLIDKLFATIEERDQGLVLRDIGELMAADLPALPLYFDVNIAAVRKAIRAITDDFTGTGGASFGYVARHAHLWDRD